jgi:uncharacterized protein (TIGR04255 family)
MMRLPEVEHERLGAPPLKAMLGQIRFPAVLQILDRGVFAAFQEAMRRDYPELSEETQVGLLVSPGGVTPSEPSRQWRLTTSNAAWTLRLASDSMTLEASIVAEYTDYSEFRRRFERACRTFLEHYSPSRIAQQGLRYINHLEEERATGGWRDWINPVLLGAIGATEFGEELQQAICDFRFRRPDGTLVLKHGVVPAGPQQTTGYLLDFDYFTQDPLAVISTEAIIARFDTLHDLIYPLFRWCVTDAAVEAFRESEVSV